MISNLPKSGILENKRIWVIWAKNRRALHCCSRKYLFMEGRHMPKTSTAQFFFWKRCLIHAVILDISGGTNVGKPTFWYRKLRYSGDRLYVIRNTFKLEAQKVDPQKLDYPINYSLKCLISLSRQLCVPWSCSTPYFNQKIHLSLVILNYKGFQVNRKWLN